MNKKVLFMVLVFFVGNAHALTYQEISAPKTYIGSCTSPIPGTGASVFNVKLNVSAAQSGANPGGSSTSYTKSTGTFVFPKNAKLVYLLVLKSKKDLFINQFEPFSSSIVNYFSETFDSETRYTTENQGVLRFSSGHAAINKYTPFVSSNLKSQQWLLTSGKNKIKATGKIVGNRFVGGILVTRFLKKDTNFFYYKNYTLTCK